MVFRNPFDVTTNTFLRQVADAFFSGSKIICFGIWVMSHRKEAPFVENVIKEDHKLDKRKLAKLIKIRLAYGKSTFYDPHTYKARYPVEIIAAALTELVQRAGNCDEQFELSAPEFRLWKQMFPGTGKSRFKPDSKNRQASA